MRPYPSKSFIILAVAGAALMGSMLLDTFVSADPPKPKNADPRAVQAYHEAMRKYQEDLKAYRARIMPPETEPEPDPGTDADDEAGPIMDYAAYYRKKKEEEEQKAIEEYNKKSTDIYRGDGSLASRRLYLLQQAYKESRERTPVINFFDFHADEDELVEAARLDEVDLDEVASDECVLDDMEIEEEKKDLADKEDNDGGLDQEEEEEDALEVEDGEVEVETIDEEEEALDFPDPWNDAEEGENDYATDLR